MLFIKFDFVVSLLVLLKEYSSKLLKDCVVFQTISFVMRW